MGNTLRGKYKPFDLNIFLSQIEYERKIITKQSATQLTLVDVMPMCSEKFEFRPKSSVSKFLYFLPVRGRFARALGT